MDSYGNNMVQKSFINDDTIKNNIFQKRIAKGLSQEDMAKRLGISRNSYRNIEKGNLNVINCQLRNIAEILDTSVEEILLGYRPVNGTNEIKAIHTDYTRSIEDIKQKYENSIAKFTEQISMLNETIRNLHEIINTKDEIISLLKRSRGQ